jgi:hypothetical protein
VTAAKQPTNLPDVYQLGNRDISNEVVSPIADECTYAGSICTRLRQLAVQGGLATMTSVVQERHVEDVAERPTGRFSGGIAAPSSCPKLTRTNTVAEHCCRAPLYFSSGNHCTLRA